MGGSEPIRIEGLNHAYGRGALRKQILFDISVEIPQGEIVIVTGPSGSGKTTLLTLVGALRSAQEGSVIVLGEQLRGAKPRTLERVRRQIGFIFQQHNLLGALTAAQNVALGARVAGEGSRARQGRRARQMLEAVGMGERLDHRPEELSGGQRQRVAIARALVGRPAMVLADEPTASLDRESGREVVELMERLAREEGATILLVTHDNRILDVADRIVHLEDGRLTTFRDQVIANNELMMTTLAESRRKRNLAREVEALDEDDTRDLLATITAESRSFIESTALAGDLAFRSMLEEALGAFTRKLRQLLNADRASLFLVEDGYVVLKVSENLEDLGEVRVPVGRGLAGTVALTGESIRIEDAYEDPRFDQAVDRQTGYRTRSVMCLPLIDHEGRIFAVAQLLNRRDGKPFDATDEARFGEFMTSIGVIFESLELLTQRRSFTAGPVAGGEEQE
jgi:putative ABC transport system ATP-binding protein